MKLIKKAIASHESMKHRPWENVVIIRMVHL